MSSEESSKMSKETLSQDSVSDNQETVRSLQAIKLAAEADAFLFGDYDPYEWLDDYDDYEYMTGG